MRNRMLRSILALCISVAVIPAAKAQKPVDYIEPSGFSLGMNFGLADIWGDVGTKSIVDHYIHPNYIKSATYMGGVFGRYTVHPSFAVRLGVSYGTLYASDSWNESAANKASDVQSDAVQRYIRNQEIKTNIWEGNLLAEISPLRFSMSSKAAKMRFQPYLLAGIAGFHFQPKSTYVDPVTLNKKWVNIYDLHLEGDGFGYAGAPAAYSLWQVAIPMGLGVRWDIGKQLGIGIEYMYRLTMTDYLDGVSNQYIDPAMFDQHLTPEKAAAAKNMYDKSWIGQSDANAYKHAPGEMRGNPSVNDGYSTISITFFYKVKHREMPWWY